MSKLFVPKGGRPRGPGQVLLEDFLKPLGISQTVFATHIGVTYARLSEIIHGKRAVTPDTAIRFGRALGTTAQMWINGQAIVDLYDAEHSPNTAEARKIKKIKAAKTKTAA